MPPTSFSAMKIINQIVVVKTSKGMELIIMSEKETIDRITIEPKAVGLVLNTLVKNEEWNLVESYGRKPDGN